MQGVAPCVLFLRVLVTKRGWGEMLSLRSFTCQKGVKYPVCHKFKVGKEFCAIDLHVKER